VMPVGVLPPNPTELVERPAFGLLMRELQGKFDYVIVDTPAANDASDAAVIAAHCGAALLVSRRDHTKVADLRALTETLRATVEARLKTPDGAAVTVSIGATLLRPEEHWSPCLGRADAALYRAKSAGRNRVEIDDERADREIRTFGVIPGPPFRASGGDTESPEARPRPAASLVSEENARAAGIR